MLNSQVVFVQVKEVLEPSPKSLIEAKGPITSDYQTWLEKEWIESLKAKYKVEVNKDVLYSIKKN
jgi:peptidyl-prolyl cis-trans isomerase SurA